MILLTIIIVHLISAIVSYGYLISILTRNHEADTAFFCRHIHVSKYDLDGYITFSLVLSLFGIFTLLVIILNKELRSYGVRYRMYEKADIRNKWYVLNFLRTMPFIQIERAAKEKSI